MTDTTTGGLRADERRRVTHALAELDMYFTVGAKPDGEPLWVLRFQHEEHKGESVEIQLQLDDSWLRLGTPPRKADVGPDLMRALLELHGRLAYARTGIGGGGVFIVADVPLPDVRAPLLGKAIGAIVTCDRELLDLLARV